MNQLPQQYFSTLIELGKDTGLIGTVLQNYPAWLFRAADKWAEQDADYQRENNDPNRLSLADPWQFLLDARDIPQKHKDVFRAAQSQLPALRHLGRMRMGIAKSRTDLYQKALKAKANGDKRSYNHAIGKIANEYVFYERPQEDVKKQNDPKLLAQMESLLKKRRAQLVHRGEGNELRQPKQWQSMNEFRKQNKAAAMLVEWWVRCGVNSLPGLMFWGNKAITKFLSNITGQKLKPENIKKLRKGLGLIPVSREAESPFVWDINTYRRNEREWKIEGGQRNGKSAFAFWGTISFNSQLVLPPQNLPVTQF